VAYSEATPETASNSAGQHRVWLKISLEAAITKIEFAWPRIYIDEKSAQEEIMNHACEHLLT
jgi:hypothetical protein